MKRLPLLALSLCLAFAAAAETYRPVGKVSEAILYPGQAQLTLRAQATLTAGEHTVLVPRTAGYIDPRTLQVRGTGDFTILSARLTQEYIPEAALTPQAKALKDSVDDLKQDLDVLVFQREVYQREEEMMLENRRITGANTGLASTEQLQKAVEYFRQHMLEVKAKQNSLDERIRRARTVYDAAKRQLDQMTNTTKAPIEQVAVQVRAAKPGAAVFFVTYITNQAGWSPSYDARAQESSAKLELVLKAQVYQNTKQNWEKVKLQFSSGNPGMGAQKPELSGLTVDFNQPRPIMYAAPAAAQMKKSRTADREEEAKEAMDERTSENIEAQAAPVARATMDDGGLGLLFTLESPANVPSSEEDQTTLELRRVELDAPQRLACAPALDQDVFVLATIKDWGNQNLLPGPVQVFYDGVFTGESFLPASTAQDSLQLSLGRERKVLVRRRPVPVKDSKSFLGSKRTQAYAFETTVTNNRKDAIVLRLEDRIPVSRNEQIEIEAQELAGAKPDDQGLLRYDIPLTPGQTKKQQLRYTIKYPKDKAISIGGPSTWLGR